jgi:alkane 1-monooxygenase
LFELTRHADHHAHPGRPYQVLRHFEDAPELPTGYAGMILLAFFPPLFRRVMDRQLFSERARLAA